jgi:hypothetical protein
MCMTKSHSARGEMDMAPRSVCTLFSRSCWYSTTSAGSSARNSFESSLGV